MNATDDKSRSITLRPVVEEDDPFLLQVYASTREEELAGWDDLQKKVFVSQQYKLQKATTKENILRTDIILLEGCQSANVGLPNEADEIRGVPCHPPEYRNRESDPLSSNC